MSDELDARLTRALESVPAAEIGDDFTSRVMQRLPARRGPAKYAEMQATEASRIGRRVGLGALVVLAGLMFGLARLAGGSPDHALAAVEWLLCAEFTGVALWLSPASRLFEG